MLFESCVRVTLNNVILNLFQDRFRVSYLIDASSFFRRSAMVAQSPAAISFGS